MGHRHVREPRRGRRRQRMSCGRNCWSATRSSRWPPAVLGAKPDELELAGGRVTVRGSTERAISLADLAAKANPLRGAVRPGTEPGLESTAYFGPDRGSTASGVHAMIVEVDVETAMVEVKRYVVVHDCGRIINPLLVDGQIHGGVAHGIGNAFYEQLVYDEQGQLLNASFMDYLLPTATDVPPIETAHRETPSPFNPIGLKGVGEAGCIPDRRGIRAGGRRRAEHRDSRNSAEPESSVHPHPTGGPTMTLNGTFTFNGPRQKVWDLLQDPDVLAKALPGTERLTLAGPDRYEGVMKVSVGPMTAAKFDVDRRRSPTSCRPSGSRCRSTAKAASASRAEPPRSTCVTSPTAAREMQYTSDVQIGGRIASVGQRLIESVSRMMMRQALEALDRELRARMNPDASRS